MEKQLQISEEQNGVKKTITDQIILAEDKEDIYHLYDEKTRQEDKNLKNGD